MRALVIHGVHDLRLEEVADVAPGPGEVAVDIAVGGICGSDLHYFNDGRVGDFALREPMILGHEVAGIVAAVGDGVTALPLGLRVAVHPARPCGTCGPCTAGRANLCPNTRFLGSAARFPHVQGGFCDRLVVSAGQIVPVPDHVPLERAVLAEPLAVALHAIRRAGSVAGRDVLVTGAGPIGVLVALWAAHEGAARIVVTDLLDEPLAIARAVGATDPINIGTDGAVVPEVDVAIEASGSPAGLAACIRAVRPGGRIVTVGLPPGTVPIPANLVVAREIEVIGSFRFTTEYAESVAALAGTLDVTPVMSGSFELGRAQEAFELASQRRAAMKVLLRFERS
jgi:L-idonate 5-dehydrogenase